MLFAWARTMLFPPCSHSISSSFFLTMTQSRDKAHGSDPRCSLLVWEGINWWSLATHSVTSWSCTCGESPLWAKKTNKSRVRGQGSEGHEEEVVFFFSKRQALITLIWFDSHLSVMALRYLFCPDPCLSLLTWCYLTELTLATLCIALIVNGCGKACLQQYFMLIFAYLIHFKDSMKYNNVE